jgi:tRNA threonylcarbamoyladenosine biosynthesis protein TsaB
MKILAADTATAWQSVAVLDGTTVLARADEDANGAHAKRLVPAIDRVLASCGLTLADLDGLAVSIGPGSFTGLRVGLATMLGFRLAMGLPLTAVPTLEAMAWNLRGAELPLCPMLKARTGEVYWGLYQWRNDGMLQPLQEERVGALEAVAQSLRGSVIAFGEGWQAHGKELRQVLGEHAVDVREAPPAASNPSAVSVGLAGLERLRCGDIVGRGVAPRYVQRAEADVVWERRGAPSPMAKASRQAARRKARVS